MEAQARLEADLRAQGHTTESVTAGGLPFVLLCDFTVQSGRHEGRVIDLGFQVVHSYPRNLSPAIHVKADPVLRDKGSNGEFTVMDSALGTGWQYWSFNMDAVWQGGCGPTLTAIVNEVMNRA